MRKVLLMLAVGLFIGGNAWAGNVDTYGIGCKAASLGGAFAAYADDPFAAYYNPAGLTQMRSATVTAGFMLLDPDLEAKNYKVKNSNPAIQDYGPVDFSDESPSLVVPHVGFAMPINEKLSAGVALYVPFGLHLEWDDTADPVTNPGAFNSYESWYAREVVTPTLAYKFNDKFSLGAGISLGKSMAGKNFWSNDLYQLGVVASGTPITAAEEVDIEDDFNYSFNVGLMYKPIDELTFGLTYRSKADVDLEGELELVGLSAQERLVLNGFLTAAPPNGLGLPQGITKTEYDVEVNDLDTPCQIQLGARYVFHERVSVEADLVWTDWSAVDEQTLEINNPDPAILALLGGSEKVLPREWDDTIQVKFGIEWKATDMFTFRGGYFYDPSPIPDDTFDIEWSDADKKTYSFGVGFNLTDHWTIDTIVQYTRTEKEREIGGESKNLNESYEISTLQNEGEVSTSAEGEIWGYGLTVTYTF